MIQEYNPQHFIKKLDLDIAVIGGGVAGVVTAIAAAREGLKVGLMQNRPVYGGPSSSECNIANDGDRLCVNGAGDYYNRNAREAGIIEEMKLEFHRRIDDGWHSHWSLILRDFIRREKNISSFLNCEAYDVDTDGSRITKVTGRLVGSETTVVFSAPLFVDASGDSFIAVAAGADFRMGRESESEFNESLAPEVADNHTQGNTILFRASKLDRPVKFVPPEWAMKFPHDDDLPYRLHNKPTAGYWWLESGGTEDTIADNEKIYDDLLAALFGVWDHLKNHGDHGADNYVISWISPFVGKRESRRLMGDYILTQDDIMTNKNFDDAVAYGGWPIDIHDIHGIKGKTHPGSPPPMLFPGTYCIPFRSLYSRNIENLMMPGRNISATHVALGSTRVMATCATCGQAVGIAASLCHKYKKSPAEIAEQHIDELKNRLFKSDQALPGIRFNQPVEFRVSASSSMPLRFDNPDGLLPLLAAPKNTLDPCDIPPEDRARAQLLPVAGGIIESITVMVNNKNGSARGLTAELFLPTDSRDFTGKLLVSDRQEVAAGMNKPVKFQFNCDIGKAHMVGLRLSAEPGIDVHTSSRPLPAAYLKPDGCYFDDSNLYCEVEPEQRVFEPENVFSGLNRTGEKPEMWISETCLPQSLTFRREAPCKINEIEIIFDTNMNRLDTRGGVPQCVKDYEIIIDGESFVKVEGNFQRRRIHQIGIYGTIVELRITATNGDASARVYAVTIC